METTILLWGLRAAFNLRVLLGFGFRGLGFRVSRAQRDQYLADLASRVQSAKPFGVIGGYVGIIGHI